MSKVQENKRVVPTPQQSSKMRNNYELPAKAVRRVCSIEHFEFTTTEELPYVRNIIGQPRGIRALEFGLDVNAPGYNVFMLGPIGTGRETAIRQFLERHVELGKIPHDWVYVNNFRVPHKPYAIKLSPGLGVKFRQAMTTLVEELRHQIPLVLEANAFRQVIDEIKQRLEHQTAEIMGEIINRAADRHLTIVRTSARLAVVPAHNGQPMPPETFALLPEVQRENIDRQRQALELQLEEATRTIRLAERSAVKKIRQLEIDAICSILDLYFAEIRVLGSGCEKLIRWLEDVYQDILKNIDIFAPENKIDIRPAADSSTAPDYSQKNNSLVQSHKTFSGIER